MERQMGLLTGKGTDKWACEGVVIWKWYQWYGGGKGDSCPHILTVLCTYGIRNTTVTTLLPNWNILNTGDGYVGRWGNFPAAVVEIRETMAKNCG